MFLDAIVDMKDEYVYMPRNITELNRVSSCYGVAGLPGCCGSIDVVHVNSLPAIGAHERQVFEKLLWGLVSSTIFVRC